MAEGPDRVPRVAKYLLEIIFRSMLALQIAFPAVQMVKAIEDHATKVGSNEREVWTEAKIPLLTLPCMRARRD
ncbi:MAG: hypothetical protein ACE5HC_00340 [Candidatus Binatia bacterium]